MAGKEYLGKKIASKDGKFTICQHLLNFCGHTSIHGLGYLQKESSSSHTKAFWFFMSLLGSCLTGFLIHRLVSDWNTYPMYTTVDNSAADVSSVSFPSVTVCQGDGHPAPSGGWAFPKKALDLYRIGWLQNETVIFTELGQKLKEYVDFAGTTYLDRYLEYLEEHKDQANFIDKQAKQIEKNNKYELSYEEVGAVGERILMQNYTESSALDFVRKVEMKSMFEGAIVDYLKRNVAKKNCNLEEKDYLYCTYMMNIYLIPTYFLLIWDTGYTSAKDGYGFGTVLSVFAPLMDSRSFMRSSSDFNAYGTCNQMGPLENKLHDIFAEMAREIGIGDVSLFELPAILESHGKPMSTEKTWLDNYPHTACKQLKDNDFPYFKQVNCDVQWGEFILKGTNNEYSVGMPRAYLTNVTSPCQEVNGTCCPLKYLNTMDRLSKIMSIMKYSTRRGQSHYNIKEVLGILEKTSFSDAEQRIRPFNESTSPDSESFMPYCQLKKGGNRHMVVSYGMHFYYPTCDAMTPAVTNRGICYGFNSMHPTELLKDSPFRQAMITAYKSELETHNHHMAFGGENGHGFEFYLDKQRILSSEQVGDDVTDVGHFSVAINNLVNSFNVKSHVSRVRTGFQTEIEVSVKEISISEGVLALPIHVRNCRLRSEVPENMTMFKVYTQELCKFECALKRSRKECQCTPWNYPTDPNDEVTVCNHYGKYCFEFYMQEEDVSNNCTCLPDCERLTYSFSEKEWPLDPDKMCKRGKDIFAYVNGKAAKSWYPKAMMRAYYFLEKGDYSQFGWNLGKDIGEFCRRVVTEDLSVVKIRLAESVFEKAQIRLKQTLTDKVSSFGGTLGLFIGASFLSLVEVCFWMVKLVFKQILYKKIA